MNIEQSQSANQVVMPRLGLTMTEARITEWLLPEGSWVEKGAPLFTLEHEKASLEIEAPASGYLVILVPVDQVVPILTPIALLNASNAAMEQPGDDLSGKQDGREASRAEVSTHDPGHTAESGRRPGAQTALKATPKARALARKQGISLEGLPGSGPRGMITSLDLKKKSVKASPVAQKAASDLGVDLAAVSGSGPRGQVMRRDVERFALPAAPLSSSHLAGLTGLRSIIANRLSASWMERPQVTLFTEADATNLVSLRQQIQTEWNTKISYNALFVKLVARALQEHPQLNAQLTPAGIQVQTEINIGVAVDTPRGLLVPVLRQAVSHPLFEIHKELLELTQRAVEGSSQPDELTGGTFTLTNLGMYEIDAFTPIINPPECAILGVGRIVSKPVGLNGQIVLREMITLSLSFDHRLVDGAPAARFLQRIKTLIERCFIIGIEP